MGILLIFLLTGVKANLRVAVTAAGNQILVRNDLKI